MKFLLLFQGNLWSWVLEPDSNDQYCVIHASGEKVVILQNNATAPSLIQKRDVGFVIYEIFVIRAV